MTKDADEATTSTVASPRVATQSDRRPWIPGETGIWVFIFIDLTVFLLLFALFMYERSEQLPLFNQSTETLNVGVGAFNTLLLLTSSLCVALGVDALRRRRAVAAQKWFIGTFLAGLAFAVVKSGEWTEKVGAGQTPDENKFYELYYVMTGLHFVHVVVGLGTIIMLWTIARRERVGHKYVRATEAGACYWHMVDLLWIVLFGLFYLMQ
ncbi:cytochrome c oxidase subunit 3 [Haloechinothrix sp. YIM 98757]|uniref:Cytochrome aa3 subunit 3 n=1 Tax=Haloechinothrix aidingensis TaxID=2752311 RepID=A0A838AC49_9PSEU|nr:cytochrome c oxidase subunit 3 [Haloechinothrix aidingensis]MBA0126748.1 cytochrome c oxidase subunit 3 [Haloechinothrix aidingensis]